jgi:hypothetical protein
MKASASITFLVIIILLFSTTIGPASAQGLEPQAGGGEGFTYQGRLVKNGSPVSGSCDFTFTLWNAASGGTTPLGTEAKTGVNVSSGVFTVLLNESGQFGATAFDGSQRWLGISVKCTGDSAAADLGRQPLSAAPYASYALTAGSVTNGVLTTGSYADPSWITSVAASKISGKVANATHADTAGSVTNGVLTTGSYADPSWITSLSASKITGVLPVAHGGTGSATQNFVDLTNVQAIGGVKTFTSAPGFSAASVAPFTVGSTTKVTNLNADLLDGQHASAFQGRVNGTCAVGSTIRAINADGSVVCQADAPLNRAAVPQANTITTVDATGKYTSITIGADGLPVISYYDNTNGFLNVVHCGNAACNSGNYFTAPDMGGVGEYTSITIGADGLPVISYNDHTNGDLKVLHCGNASCSSGNVLTTVDSAGDVGYYTSVTIGADGLPVISYYDNTNYDLKVAHCGNASCNSGNALTTVDSAGDAGQYNSITIGADGLPVISYYDLINNGDLKVLHCGNASCSSGNALTTVDSTGFVGWYTSVTIGMDGLPIISYRDNTNGVLKVAHCGNAACSSGPVLTTVDSTGVVGQYTSITIGADSLPVISYYNYTNGYLKVAHCGNAACSSGNALTTVDNAGNVGQYTSITIGVDGLPVISYYDVTNGDLKVLHCSNAFCTPYLRRR